MANTTTEKTSKRSWFKGLKSEYKKIVWPDKEALTKQSIAVVIVTVILGLIISALDALIELGIGVILG
ncbi:MAG TPA: preprotein translocase subunit SecE [Lachnospiraceae bacterium]|nr:preprotein translocase subunit SecE [Lachnospiraceae bacterium]HBY72612.1 preprotein translocase subunit SecE [Lachnospiraceae bacterium]HCA69237.1 preprotein translocase subunit SecE [Lachnospiraceae bacterium]HCM13342.1 preprotein translocase subunit SecE [Lachnospiraceae bacterium]HCR40268.1 preprotein translocase subunit SecE [Lachnospiraceae bacterium]